MELIPILATIILVATISTFFLSIGAYVLFKIREKRGTQTTTAAPETMKAELVTPEGDMQRITHEHLQTMRPGQETPITKETPITRERPVTRERPITAGPLESQTDTQQYVKKDSSEKEEQKENGEKKFVEMTSDEKKKDQKKNDGALKWR